MHYRRIIEQGAIYSQPFSEGGGAAAGAVAFGTEARPVDGGFLVSGKKIFASLSGAADYRNPLHGAGEGEQASCRNTLYLGDPGEFARRQCDRRLGSARHARHGLAHAAAEGRVRARARTADAARRLLPRRDSWPHMFLTLSPTYMGLAQAAYDFTVAYLRGEAPGTPPVKRRMYPTKQIAVAEMHVMLEQTKALWFQAVSEARANPTREQVLRAYAAQHTVMENANTLAAKAIRTCGGQSMLKSLPLERIYRDSRCGSLMLPWTAEICLDRLGRETLYQPGEKDE